MMRWSPTIGSKLAPPFPPASPSHAIQMHSRARVDRRRWLLRSRGERGRTTGVAAESVVNQNAVGKSQQEHARAKTRAPTPWWTIRT